MPHNMPHVSRFLLVFDSAYLRNSVRRVGGRKIVRSGLPFSRYAEGRKVKVALGSDMLASIGSTLSFPGRGGGSGSCTWLKVSFGGLGGRFRLGDIDLDRDSKLSWYRTGCDLVIDG